jgi:protein-tyrosine kinase
MSRIDEALKRAERTESASAHEMRRPNSGAGARANELTVLDTYVAEEPVRAREAALPKTVAATLARTPYSSRIVLPAALEDKLVIGRTISPVTVEQYRRLAAVLHDLQAQHGLKTLMVTSAAPQEGKTLTIVNLALTLSESYRQRVLLVDADLRRPTVHTVFGIPNGPGLSENVVAGGHPAAPVEISPYLSVLRAGNKLSSPLAMLTSDRIREVLSSAAERFDWVLLDTPPVGFLPDAQLAGRLSDAALLVIAAGVTPYSLVQRAIADIGPERIVGTVLNRVDKRVLSNGESYGGYYSSTQLNEASGPS